MTGRALIVFDGDDTLWETEVLYDRARQRIRKMLIKMGVDGARWELVERKIDLDRVGTMGFAWHRFPRSCVDAFREVMPSGRPFFTGVARIGIFFAAAKVYVDRPPLMPDVHDVLRAANANSDLVLLTKGEPWIQCWRIRQSGLRRYFKECVIVRDKTVRTFEEVGRLGHCERQRISVGNSLASDIGPAVLAGFAGIQVDSHMWEHERRDAATNVSSVIRVSNLQDALDAILRIRTIGCATFPV